MASIKEIRNVSAVILCDAEKNLAEVCLSESLYRWKGTVSLLEILPAVNEGAGIQEAT